MHALVLSSLGEFPRLDYTPVLHLPLLITLVMNCTSLCQTWYAEKYMCSYATEGGSWREGPPGATPGPKRTLGPGSLLLVLPLVPAIQWQVFKGRVKFNSWRNLFLEWLIEASSTSCINKDKFKFTKQHSQNFQKQCNAHNQLDTCPKPVVSISLFLEILILLFWEFELVFVDVRYWTCLSIIQKSLFKMWTLP